ncbi:MAG: hypothetical protein ABJE66_10425 [Deltaproteobacteria bacterium]
MVRARLVLLACLACFAWGCADAQHPGEESASSDDVPRHTSHRHKKKKKVADDDSDNAPKKHKSSSGDDDDDDRDAPRKKKHAADDDDDGPKKPVKKKVAAKKHADDDDDDDDDAPRKPAKKAKKSDDDDDSAAKKKAAAKKATAEKAAEDKAAAKEAAEERAAAKKAAAEKAMEEKVAAKKAAAEKAAEDNAAEDKAAKKKAAEDDTPKVSDDDDDDDEKLVAKPKVATKAKAKAKAKPKSDDDDEVKPKPVAAKAKPKADDEDEDDAPKRKSKVTSHDDDKPEPAKKQRTIEEDVAVDDPLATKPPVRSAAADEEEQAEDTTTTSAGAVAVAAAPSRNPPLQDRALTTPMGQLDLHAGLPINVLSVTDTTGMTTSSTSEGLALGVAYGFNPKAEVGLDYTLGLSPGAIKGPITLHGAYTFAHGKLDVAGAAAFAIDFADTVNPATMTTTTDTALSLQLGAWARYHATPTVSIFSGLPGLPNATSGLSRLAFGLPVTGYQVQIGVSARGVMALTLPIGIGYQASPKLYTFASLNLANIRIANTSNAFLFKDYIPIAVGGFYDFDTWSLGASFADDLKQGFGYLRFELIARYLLH